MARRTAPNRGGVRKLPSGRWQARFVAPDGKRRNAPFTFQTRRDAEAWLSESSVAVSAGRWRSPEELAAEPKVPTLGDYAATWLSRRRVRGRKLSPRTFAEYRALLDRHILPTFGDERLTAIGRHDVDRWYESLPAKKETLRARAYSLFKSILASAVADDLIVANPARIRGAGRSHSTRRVRPATPAEVIALADGMPSLKYRVMVLVAAWTALRFGELTELRRSDIDITNGIIHVRRAVTRAEVDPDALPAGSQSCGCRPFCVIGPPKSAAGVRDVHVPPHIVPALREWLQSNMNGRDGLVFPAADGASHMAPSSLSRVFYRAREKAGRADLRWHDLRHSSLTAAAQTGATLAELMSRAGHSSPQAALRYQHATSERDEQIAARLSALAEKQV